MNSIEQTAQLLFKAVKRASVNHTDITVGDYIIVTGANDDTAGIVDDVNTIEDNTTIVLSTSSGKEILQISSKNFVHIIQKANMLNMRDHIEYERDLKDIDKDTHKYTEKDQHPLHGLDEKLDKSNLPASKISLTMKKQKGTE